MRYLYIGRMIQYYYRDTLPRVVKVINQYAKVNGRTEDLDICQNYHAHNIALVREKYCKGKKKKTLGHGGSLENYYLSSNTQSLATLLTIKNLFKIRSQHNLI